MCVSGALQRIGMMSERLPTRKIENRAITALRQIVDMHPTMEPCFNERDKEHTVDYRKDPKPSKNIRFSYHQHTRI